MAASVALLRAINIGSNRRIPMAGLRTALEDAGFDGVTTYLQSGNVIFVSRGSQPGKVEGSIEGVLRAAFKLDIDVAVRTATQLARVTRANPLGGARVDPKSLHVAFLKAKPSPAAARRLAELDFGRDEFVLRGAEIYLRYPNGMGRSRMSNAAFERVLRTPATVRNWRVVNELADRVASAG